MGIELSPAFLPLQGLAGGALIGAVCVARLRVRGRLSGLALDSLFAPGLVLGGALAASLRQGDAAFEALDPAASTARLGIAGLLVGVGVPLGKGCTSGTTFRI